MQVYDVEGERKIERHRILRSDKGFLTIEQPFDVEKAIGKMADGERTALLECISNLTANEMFAGEVPETEEVVTEKIVKENFRSKKLLRNLIFLRNQSGGYSSATSPV